MKCKSMLTLMTALILALLMISGAPAADACPLSVPSGEAVPTPITKVEGTPVWHFCNGTRFDPENVVVSCFEVDCEAGLVPLEMTPEEKEAICRLALEGLVTGKESDLCVTGGTTLYIFETPEGEHLLSFELWHGLLADFDGMYQIYGM